MTKIELQQLKERIQKLKVETLKNLEKGDDGIAVAGDYIDEEFSNRSNMLEFRIRSRDKFFIQKIDKALKSIDSEQYGQCSECGCEIGYSRLMARPMTDKCIDCKEFEERQEGNILYEKKSHSLGQEIESNVSNVVFLGTKKSRENRQKTELSCVIN